MIGELIDHYRVLELVGRGAMGVVYKALDVNLDRQVAMKVMSVESRSDPDFVERFRQEARIQGALNHPNVALLFDYFIHNDAPVAVMELIDGESLEQLIRRRGPIPAYESIPIFKQALRGVAAAHRAGIIHRDLKASNLMITKDGVVKVMDFGIAKRQGSMAATKASTSVGSPLYMAPEQILGRAVDCRADVYALGITLYQLLSGQPPFNPRGKTQYGVLNAHVNDQPDPPTVHCHDIPQPIVDAVMRSLSKEPDARFQSADDFMRALPDVPLPSGVAPQMGPTATVARPPLGPTGTVAISRLGPTGTVAIEYSPQVSADPVAPPEPSGAIVIEHPPPTPHDPSADTIVFDYSPETAPQELYLRPPASSPAASVPSTAQGAPARAGRTIIVAALLAVILLGTLLRHTLRLGAMPPSTSAVSSEPRFTPAQASTATPPPESSQTAPSTDVTEPPPGVPSSEAEPAEAASPETIPAATTLTPTAAPVRHDLSGTWRGEYVDASGKPLVRVVSLSINRVHNDGGIEGTLQYQAASGEGECQLHPRGSTYLADEQRLQLSPEGCSPHYPKELGVPLDFDGVTPQANILRDGRIEAPTGEVIRVKLRRVRGV